MTTETAQSVAIATADAQTVAEQLARYALRPSAITASDAEVSRWLFRAVTLLLQEEP